MENKNNFSLIETLLWEQGEYFLLDLHMKRLNKSASYFSFHFDRAKTESTLKEKVSAFENTVQYSVRLLLDSKGDITLAAGPLKTALEPPFRIAISEKKTDRKNVFLLHKTTERDLYNKELAKYRAKGFFDIIFRNTEDEITEGSITNIVIQKDDECFTPPASSGLLAGVFREYLLKTCVGARRAVPLPPLKEKILFLEDLENADKIFLVNSVRRLVPVELKM